MKKYKGYILLLFCLLSVLFFFVFKKGTSSDQVITIIHDRKNTRIAINYPKTSYTTFNKEIEDYIHTIEDTFTDEYTSFLGLKGKAELNIDYKYYITKEKYISVTLYTYIDSSMLSTPIEEIKTFTFDTHKKRFLNLLDLCKEEEMCKDQIENTIEKKYRESYEELLTSSYLKNLSFSINEKDITIYIPSYRDPNNPFVINLPYSYFTLEKKEKHNVVFKYEVKEKSIDPKKKVIALTFDDGPSKYTKDLLKLLKKYDVTATFFVLGNKVPLYTETLKKMISNGNEIGNHSYNHKLMSSLKKEEIIEQIEQTQSALKSTLGYTPKSLRPTYGSVNQKIRENTSLTIVLWNVDTLDWKIKDPKKIAERGLKVKDGDIILMHDSKERTIKALSIMIPKLLDEGYQFVTISELEEVKLLRKKME